MLSLQWLKLVSVVAASVNISLAAFTGSSGILSPSHPASSSAISSGSHIVSTANAPSTSHPLTSSLPISFTPSSISASAVPASLASSAALSSESGAAQGSFTPFARPSQSPVSGVFPSTDPQHPPPVNDPTGSVPDFLPAWETAYSKAKAKV